MFSLMTRFHFYFYFLLKMNSTPSTVIYYFQIKVTHPTIKKDNRSELDYLLAQYRLQPLRLWPITPGEVVR